MCDENVASAVKPQVRVGRVDLRYVAAMVSVLLNRNEREGHRVVVAFLK